MKSLRYNPVERVPLPAGSGILIYILGLGVYPLCSFLCCLWQGPWHSSDRRFTKPALVLLSSVLVHSLFAPSTGVWPKTIRLSVSGGGSHVLGGANNRQGKKSIYAIRKSTYELLIISLWKVNKEYILGIKIFFTVLVFGGGGVFRVQLPEPTNLCFSGFPIFTNANAVF